jgi:hypothetical protein
MTNKQLLRFILPCFVALFLIICGVVLYRQHSRGSLGEAHVTTLALEAPNLVVTGEHLGKVELWAIPTGTGITEDEYNLLGPALLDHEAAGGRGQVWTYPVPAPMLVTEIFAKGYDAAGKEAGRASLPVVGVTELYRLLWGDPEATATASTTPGSGTATSTLTLAVGGSAAAGDAQLTLTRVYNDSRCPLGVQCIRAGEVSADIAWKVGVNDGVATVSTMQPEKTIEGVTASGTKAYRLTLKDVTPSPRPVTTISEQTYRVILLVAPAASTL